MGNVFSYIIATTGIDNTIITEIYKLEQNIVNINTMLEHLNQKTDTISSKINSLETQADDLFHNLHTCNNTSENSINSKSISHETRLNTKLEWDNYDTRLKHLESSDRISII